MVQILDALTECIVFAQVFNNDIKRREQLAATGWLGSRSRKPELYMQEAHGLQIILQLLGRMYADAESIRRAAAIQNRSDTISPPAPPSSVVMLPPPASAPLVLTLTPLPPPPTAVPMIPSPTAALSPSARLSFSGSSRPSTSVLSSPGGVSSGGLSLARLMTSPARFNAVLCAEPRLLELSEAVLRDYLVKESRPECEDELHCKEGVVVLILQTFVTMHEQQFRAHLLKFFPIWTELIDVQSLSVRKTLRELLATRVTQILPEIPFALSPRCIS